MNKELTKEQILALPKYCTNLKLGGSCWANCPWRENGRCELDINQVLKNAIEYLEKEK